MSDNLRDRVAQEIEFWLVDGDDTYIPAKPYDDTYILADRILAILPTAPSEAGLRAIKKYGRHIPPCLTGKDPFEPCTCGLSTIIAGHPAEEGEWLGPWKCETCGLTQRHLTHYTINNQYHGNGCYGKMLPFERRRIREIDFECLKKRAAELEDALLNAGREITALSTPAADAVCNCHRRQREGATSTTPNALTRRTMEETEAGVNTDDLRERVAASFARTEHAEDSVDEPCSECYQKADDLIASALLPTSPSEAGLREIGVWLCPECGGRMGAPGYFKGRVVLHCAHCDDQRTITREAWLKSGQYDSVAAAPAEEKGVQGCVAEDQLARIEFNSDGEEIGRTMASRIMAALRRDYNWLYALLAKPTPAPDALRDREESAWLIELPIEQSRQGCPVWFTGDWSAPVHWTANANEAVRFCRREDSDRVILGREDKSELAISTSHMWIAPASPAKEGGFWIEESEEIKPGTILILRPPDLGRGENGPQLAGRIINLDAPAASEKRGK